MAKIKTFTLYKSNGTKQVLYGYNISEALDAAGFSTDELTLEVREYREGFDSSLKFIDGKWETKTSKNNIQIDEYHTN